LLFAASDKPSHSDCETGITSLDRIASDGVVTIPEPFDRREARGIPMFFQRVDTSGFCVPLPRRGDMNVGDGESQLFTLSGL